MGGAGLRGAHTERRCAGVVDGAGLAGGEMSEDPLDDLASSLRERHFRGVSMQAMPHRQDCRFAQPEAAPKGCGTRMCRMNSIGSSTT